MSTILRHLNKDHTSLKLLANSFVKYFGKKNKNIRSNFPSVPHKVQAWGQSTRYFGTLVLEYRFVSTRRCSVLVLLKSTCTPTCTQLLLKMKVLLTSTYEYFTSTNHLKLIQNTSHTSHKSL